MNIKKTPKIIFQDETHILWNFSLNKYPKALHSLVEADLESAHEMVAKFNQEANTAKQKELFEQIVFFHNYLSGTYLRRRQAAEKTGMTLDDMRENDRNINRQLKDANPFATSYEDFTQELPPEIEESDLPTSSSYIAQGLDSYRAAFSKSQSEKAKKNTGKRVRKKK